MVRPQICRPWWKRLFRRSLKRIISSLIGLALVLVLAATLGSAQKAPQLPVLTDHLPGFSQERSPISPASETVVLNDPQELETFIDQLIGDEIAKSSVPGAVISVVKDVDGRYQNERILQPETTRLMHETHFAHHPQLLGTGYSFRERLVNGIRTIGHLGSLRGYSSSLTLMPDQNIGFSLQRL